MNVPDKEMRDRLRKYEVSAIYDDAGTPPRDEWRKRAREARHMKRHEQLRRIDAWLLEFRRESPVLFTVFAIGIGMCFAGVLLKVLE